MDIVIFRKLTRKSVLGFGRFADKTVQYLLECQKGYISWVYYNCPNITFMDDVLEEMGIKGKWVIEKPGTNPKIYEARWRNVMNFKYGSKAGCVIASRRKKKAKAKLRAAIDATTFSKAEMQAMNHGHINFR